MKKSILSCLFILFAIAVFAQHTKKDLVGKWEGTDTQGVTASISFLDTARVMVNISGNAFPEYNFHIDFAKSPATIDIVMKKPDAGEATLPGFLLFLDDNTIKWQIFPDGNRPATYNENQGGPVITLKRVK